MRVITAVTAVTGATLSAGLVLGGGLGASAAPSSSINSINSVDSADAADAAVTLPEGGVLEQRITTLCTRIPDLLQRAGTASTRLAADASTKGSIAWLEAKQDRAEKAGHPQLAQHIGRVIERRTTRQAKLPEIKEKLIAAQGECTTLGLPT